MTWLPESENKTLDGGYRVIDRKVDKGGDEQKKRQWKIFQANIQLYLPFHDPS